MEDTKTEAKQEKPFINIKLDDDGGLQVQSNILNDQLFCLGILESAKLAVIQHNTTKVIKNSQSKIIKPGGILNFARRRF